MLCLGGLVVPGRFCRAQGVKKFEVGERGELSGGDGLSRTCAFVPWKAKLLIPETAWLERLVSGLECWFSGAPIL